MEYNRNKLGRGRVKLRRKKAKKAKYKKKNNATPGRKEASIAKQQERENPSGRKGVETLH